jgi:hypothetical protein
MPGDFKDTVSKKIKLGPLNWPRKNILQIFVKKKFFLCVYGEYAKRQKSIEIKDMSVNNRTT